MSEYLSVKEVSIIFNVHVNTIHNWIEKGIFNPVRIGKRCTRIPVSEVNALKQQGERKEAV